MDEARPGNLDIWEIWDLEKSKKVMSFLIIIIHHAQNVGEVQISKKKQLLAPFGAILGRFFLGPEKISKIDVVLLFSSVAQWALFNRFGGMAAIFLLPLACPGCREEALCSLVTVVRALCQILPSCHLALIDFW